MNQAISLGPECSPKRIEIEFQITGKDTTITISVGKEFIPYQFKGGTSDEINGLCNKEHQKEDYFSTLVKIKAEKITSK